MSPRIKLIPMTANRFLLFFFFNDPAPTEIYPLSLHDPLPIFTPQPLHLAEPVQHDRRRDRVQPRGELRLPPKRAEPLEGAHEGVLRELPGQLVVARQAVGRSEEHTSELQSLAYLVCRLLLEKK